MSRLFRPDVLPLYAATHTAGYGTGWWLSEWLWQPGNYAADLIVFQAFAANFVVLAGLYVAAFFRKTGVA